MKKTVAFLLIFLLLIPFPVVNLFAAMNKESAANESIDKGISLLDTYAACDLQAVEKKVTENVRKIAQGKEVKKVLEEIDNGETTYRNVFKNTVIVGDSLMNGLEAYNILNPNNLVTQVSASLYHLSDNMNRIIGMNPPVLILHYGINMIGTNDAHLDFFITTYTDLLNRLKEELPDTRIIVSGLFPVDTGTATGARFKNVKQYNDSLIRMCAELEVEFMDSSQVLWDHPECYGPDGIHLSKRFYSDYWLRFIVEDKGIAG